MNLCTNACHAMTAGGVLRVMLDVQSIEAERSFAHTTLHAGVYARLTVQDTGVGMDEATLARIFEPFFTTKEVGKGTGLGLALVYGIVTDSSGAIDVTSTPGAAARFPSICRASRRPPPWKRRPPVPSRAAAASACSSSTTKRRWWP